jgi:hypothetical protein
MIIERLFTFGSKYDFYKKIKIYENFNNTNIIKIYININIFIYINIINIFINFYFFIKIIFLKLIYIFILLISNYKYLIYK